MDADKSFYCELLYTDMHRYARIVADGADGTNGHRYALMVWTGWLWMDVGRGERYRIGVEDDAFDSR